MRKPISALGGILLAAAAWKGAEPDGPPPLCGRSHFEERETPLDPVAVERAYAALVGELDRRLAAGLARTPELLARPYETGLPACAGTNRRVEKVSDPELRRLRGRRILFLAARDPERARLPAEVESDPAAEILVLGCRRLSDLGTLARRFGRPVGLASRELAAALGVRCADTWIEVSDRGDEIALHEGN